MSGVILDAKLRPGTISKDNNIPIENLRREKEWDTKKMLKKYAVKQWCGNGL